MLSYFHIADLDDRCKTGFTLLRGYVYVGTRPKLCVCGIRVLLEIPTRWKEFFELDYGNIKGVFPVNLWWRADLYLRGGYESDVACGKRART